MKKAMKLKRTDLSKVLTFTDSQTNGKFYDFYRDGVTQSFIDTWLRCPHQAKLQYVDGWKPKAPESEAIIFGNCCHHVLEKSYSQIQAPTPGLICSYVNSFEETLDWDNFTADQATSIEATLAKAEAVMKGYFQFYASDFENNWEIAETIFKVPFTLNNRTPTSKSDRTFISGKLDGGFIESNGLWLMDHKCMGRINLGNLLILLPVDIQVNTYLWCVRQMRRLANDPNPTPKGFKYNVIRNPQTKPSVRKEEDLKAYKDRIEDDIQKQPKHYFHRIRIPISDEEIDRWESDWLQPIIRDMERWFLSDYTWPEYYRPNNLKTEYGTLSPWAPALAENDFSSYEKRKHLFEELVE